MLDDDYTDEYDDMGIDPDDVDDANVDPRAMANMYSTAGDTPRVGPTKAAAAAGDINYSDGSDAYSEYEGRQASALQALRDARSRAMEALKPTDDKSRYLALAAGFLAPTRTGGFGESVSNAISGYLPYKQQQRQEELGYKSALSKYDTDIASAEYAQSVKPPTFTEIYTPDGKRQKVMVVNGRPHPIGGSYAPPGAGGQNSWMQKLDLLQHATPEQRALIEKYLVPQGSQTTVSVGLNEDKSFGKNLGMWDAKKYGELQDAALKAPVTIANYQRLGSLLGQQRLGKYRGAINEFSKALQTFGIDPASIGIEAHTGLADAANAAQRAMALELRNPAGGAGMPGAMSDPDREFLVSMSPSLETSPDAVPLMVNWQIKLARRSQDVAKLARKYNKDHGTVDEGFYDELQTWSDAHPLFDDEDRAAIEKLGSGGAPPPTDTGAADPVKILDDAGFEVSPDGKIVPKAK